MRALQIGSRSIDDESDCFVIAEIGHNHQGSLDRCKDLFIAARDAGADAVKLQKRMNRELFTKSFYDSPYRSMHSFGRSYGEHREALEFDRCQYLELANLASRLNLAFIVTPFCLKSVEFLEDIGVSAYKIASASLGWTELIDRVAATRRPMLVSTGGATVELVSAIVERIQRLGVTPGILQCTSTYPSPAEELDLRVIGTYRELFPNAVVGISEHTESVLLPSVAYALGARIVEKHFTLDKTSKGSDQVFSLTPEQLEAMVHGLRETRLALGEPDKRVHTSEAAALYKMGTSLVATRALPIGQRLSRADIAVKSPGGGLAPNQVERLLGRILVRPLAVEEQFDLSAVDDGASKIEVREEQRDIQ
jgi:N-acetylneuraminate synthase/sialic acid synthase